MINIYEPDIKKYSKSSILAIETGWISNHGEYVNKSTELLKDIVKSKYCILMANGTCATHCLFLSLKFKYPNISTIYVPNNCYIAAWNAALMEYKMIEIEVMNMCNETWNINVNDDYLMSLKENSAMLIVHNLGNIINIQKIKRLRPDIIIVEDNCEGMFGKYEDVYSGMSENSLCSSCSFYGNKIITTGEGGAFFTQNEDIYNYIKSVYSQGMSSTRYLHDIHAYNYRMTNIQAAFLFEQLNDLENILENKYKIFQTYDKLLEGLVKLGKIDLIKHEENTIHSPWIYALRIVDNTKSIEETTHFFKENNIDIRPFFYPINRHKHLKHIKNEDLVPLELNKEIIMIPSSPTITYEQQQQVCDVVYKFMLFNRNIEVIEVNKSNREEIYIDFLKNINDHNFRYFNKRNIESLNNHIITIVLKDNVNNNYVGYVHIDYENYYWLGIYIEPKYQKKQIGTILLNYILQNIRLTTIKEIHLSVDKNNDHAIALYKSHNFTTTNDSDSNNYYIMKLCK